MSPPDKKKYGIVDSTASKAVDVGAKLVLGLIPGASTAYELGVLGVDLATRIIHEKQEKRLLQFHEMLIKQDSWDQQLADACIDVVDYHLLLAACVKDLEDEKVDLYATLARNVATKKITSSNTRFFTLALQELSFFDLNEMREAYVSNHFSLMENAGSGNFKKDLSIASATNNQAYGRRLMELRGFLKGNTISEFGEAFVESCYSPSMLTPAAINRKEWTNPHSPLMVICYELIDEETSRFCDDLTRQLRDKGLKIGSIGVLSHNHFFHSPTVSLLVIKSNPQIILQQALNLEKVLKKTCIALFLREDFPEELESIRSQFKDIIMVTTQNGRFDTKAVAEYLMEKE